MSLIKHGDFFDLSVAARPTAAEAVEGAEDIASFNVLSEASAELPADSFEFATSKELRGVALQSLRLEQGFQSLLKRLFNADSDVYFLVWAWDFSGQPAVLYPSDIGAGASTLIPMRGGELREFIGAGVVLFPPRKVTAGLALRLQIWESKHGTREFGKTMESVAATVQQSDLNELLTMISVATGATTATVDLAWKASLQLAEAIGKILQATSDDYVDYYEGYFPARDKWTPPTQSWDGHRSTITLTRLT